MAVDLASLSQAITLIKTAFDSMKAAKDLLPEGSRKEEVEVALACRAGVSGHPVSP
jgi:hypothetical protein